MKSRAKFIFKEIREQEIYSKKKDKTYNKLFVVCDKMGQLDNYEPKSVAFTAFGAATSDIKAIAVEPGHEVEMEYRIKCREFNGNFFTELEIVSMTSLGPYRGASASEANPQVSGQQAEQHWSDGDVSSNNEPDPFGESENNHSKESDDPFGSSEEDAGDDLPF